MPVAAIAFTPAPPDQSPNVRDASVDEAVATYHEAMVVAFASYHRWSPDATLRLVTDVEPPGRYAELYASVGVKVLLVPFVHRPPSGFSARFTASLYSIDAMEALCATYPAEPIALLDPDCLAVRSLGTLFARASQRVCAYPMSVPPDRVVNGLSASDAAVLHRELDVTLDGLPTTYGGECYAFTASLMGPVLERVEDAFGHTLGRAHSEPRFVTEEHLLNYALRRSGPDEVDDLLKRIWTAPRLRTVDGNELSLTLWHLPAEKDRGFRGMVDLVADRGSWFWMAPDDEFRARLGRRTGVTRRPPSRWLYDTTGRIMRMVQHMLRPARGSV